MKGFKTGDQLLSLIQDKYPDYHPIIHAAELAHDANTPIPTKADMIKTMLKYTTPDVKSIDITSRIGGNVDRLEMLVYGLDDEEEDEYGDIIDGDFEQIREVDKPVSTNTETVLEAVE